MYGSMRPLSLLKNASVYVDKDPHRAGCKGKLVARRGRKVPGLRGSSPELESAELPPEVRRQLAPTQQRTEIAEEAPPAHCPRRARLHASRAARGDPGHR